MFQAVILISFQDFVLLNRSKCIELLNGGQNSRKCCDLLFLLEIRSNWNIIVVVVSCSSSKKKKSCDSATDQHTGVSFRIGQWMRARKGRRANYLKLWFILTDDISPTREILSKWNKNYPKERNLYFLVNNSKKCVIIVLYSKE